MGIRPCRGTNWASGYWCNIRACGRVGVLTGHLGIGAIQGHAAV